MNTFSINETALAEIQCIIRSNRCIDPIVVLGEEATLTISDNVKAAFLTSTSEEEKQAIASKVVDENTLTYFLSVSAYERKECRPEDLIVISGVTFAMAAHLRSALRGYCLDYLDGRFLLRSADDIALNLRSVMERGRLG